VKIKRNAWLKSFAENSAATTKKILQRQREQDDYSFRWHRSVTTLISTIGPNDKSWYSSSYHSASIQFRTGLGIQLPIKGFVVFALYFFRGKPHRELQEVRRWSPRITSWITGGNQRKLHVSVTTPSHPRTPSNPPPCMQGHAKAPGSYGCTEDLICMIWYQLTRPVLYNIQYILTYLGVLHPTPNYNP